MGTLGDQGGEGHGQRLQGAKCVFSAGGEGRVCTEWLNDVSGAPPEEGGVCPLP